MEPLLNLTNSSYTDSPELNFNADGLNLNETTTQKTTCYTLIIRIGQWFFWIRPQNGGECNTLDPEPLQTDSVTTSTSTTPTAMDVSFSKVPLRDNGFDEQILIIVIPIIMLIGIFILLMILFFMKAKLNTLLKRKLRAQAMSGRGGFASRQGFSITSKNDYMTAPYKTVCVKETSVPITGAIRTGFPPTTAENPSLP